MDQPPRRPSSAWPRRRMGRVCDGESKGENKGVERRMNERSL